jgi:hypothetical protein
MTDQHPGYREDWDITSEAGSLCFASAIYSRLVGGEQDEATLQWLAKYLRANAAPHHITIELRDRIEALEATQHAHIEAKAAEAGARRAVEQMRSRPGSWQPLKVETTYGSDASIPKLSEHRAPDEWLLHSYKVGPAEPVEDWGKGFTQVRTPDPAAGAQVGRSSAAVDQVLALQDQIRDGTLTLADALKEIGGKPIERTRQTTYLVEKIRVRMIQEQKNSNSWQAVAEAVLREVAKWLRSEYPQREGFGTAWASLLDNEANC